MCRLNMLFTTVLLLTTIQVAYSFITTRTTSTEIYDTTNTLLIRSPYIKHRIQSSTMIDRTKKGVKPLSATITSTKEISAIEAIFPFFNHLFITPYQVRRLIKYATGDISHISRMFVFAVAGFVIPYVGRFSRDVLSKGKMGDIFTFQPLSSTTDDSEEDGYKKTKWYHVTNHIRQGFLLGSITNLVDFCIDIIQAYGGIHSSYFKIVTEFFTSASFTIWAMYRMKFYKDFLIKVFLKKRFPPHIVARWKELLNYCLYVITGIVVLDMMGVQYMLALKTISAFGGIGTFNDNIMIDMNNYR